MRYLALVLHAHLPYIRHPEHEYFLEENWLYEAITETYPLLKVFEKLAEDGVKYRLTMSLTYPYSPCSRIRFQGVTSGIEKLINWLRKRLNGRAGCQSSTAWLTTIVIYSTMPVGIS